MIINSLSFHISPQWKQSKTNLSVERQNKCSLKYVHKSKSLDPCHRQFASHRRSAPRKELSDDFICIDLYQASNKLEDLFSDTDFPEKDKHRYLTISLNANDDNDQDIKHVKDLNEILNDIQIYKNQLHDTHGSIRIQAYPSQSKRCYCDRKQSIDICGEISSLENELFQNDSAEYIYKIEGVPHSSTIFKWEVPIWLRALPVTIVELFSSLQAVLKEYNQIINIDPQWMI